MNISLFLSCPDYFFANSLLSVLLYEKLTVLLYENLPVQSYLLQLFDATLFCAFRGFCVPLFATRQSSP